MNPLLQLGQLGQSVWMDNLRRKDIDSGFLKKLIDNDGLTGVTSNPTIFEKALKDEVEYEDLLQRCASGGLSAREAYEVLVVRDVQDAADLLRPVFEKTRGRDGYVSLEVSPLLAFEADSTLVEARRLWKSVNRPNLMIKVPASEEGLSAIEELTAEGMNINITLLFSREMYRRVAEAFIRGLELFSKRGGDVRAVASVASFFVSRIDVLVDSIVEKKLETADSEQKLALQALMGQVAIANAKLAYRIYQEVFASSRWQSLAHQGARTQRVLWASTGTKNPKYRDVLYIEELIGPDTVNTMPLGTLSALRDHGKVEHTLTRNLERAQTTMANLKVVRISIDDVTNKLLHEGVRLFSDSFGKAIAIIDERIRRATQVHGDAGVHG